MSFFSVTVVTPERPTDEALRAALQPFHEFESTEVDDEYVQSIDVLAEVQANFKEYAEPRQSIRNFIQQEYSLQILEAGEPRGKRGWYRLDSEGNLIEAVQRTNPNKKWDFWSLADPWELTAYRCHGALTCTACKRDITNSPRPTFAFLRDGQWTERGRMCWFGEVDGADPNWPEKFAEMWAIIPDDHWVTIVSCHI